jgi:hypothetical protein
MSNVRRGSARGSLLNRARTSARNDDDGQFQARHLSAICYLLLAIGYRLSAIGYSRA